jgi:hypothetical protein
MNRDSAEALSANYDLMFVTCGYESRATHIWSRFTGRVEHLAVLDYGCDGVHSYDTNRLLLGSQVSSWIDLDGPEVAERIAANVSERMAELANDASLCSDGAPVRVFVDVSSCSRSVLANLLLALAAPHDRRVLLTCGYSISDFYEPPESELPSSISEPVIGALSGWSHDLSKPPCAIIGLGFEPGRALGSIDYLEVPEVRLFLPQGPDDRFEFAVLAANRLLTDEVGQPLRYQVRDPEDAFQKLGSLVGGLLPRFRPIIIPLGPKIFATLSMLLALRLFPQICIWRTSAGSGEEVSDRCASGTVVVFDYELPRVS